MTRHDDQNDDLARGTCPARPRRGALPLRSGGLRLRHLGAVAGVRGVGQGPHRLGRPGRAVRARPVAADPGRPAAGRPRRPGPPQTAADRREPVAGRPPARPRGRRRPGRSVAAVRGAVRIRRGGRRPRRGRVGAGRDRRRPAPARRLQRSAHDGQRGHETPGPAGGARACTRRTAARASLSWTRRRSSWPRACTRCCGYGGRSRHRPPAAAGSGPPRAPATCGHTPCCTP